MDESVNDRILIILLLLDEFKLFVFVWILIIVIVSNDVKVLRNRVKIISLIRN